MPIRRASSGAAAGMRRRRRRWAIEEVGHRSSSSLHPTRALRAAVLCCTGTAGSLLGWELGVLGCSDKKLITYLFCPVGYYRLHPRLSDKVEEVHFSPPAPSEASHHLKRLPRSGLPRLRFLASRWSPLRLVPCYNLKCSLLFSLQACTGTKGRKVSCSERASLSKHNWFSSQ